MILDDVPLLRGPDHELPEPDPHPADLFGVGLEDDDHRPLGLQDPPALPNDIVHERMSDGLGDPAVLFLDARINRVRNDGVDAGRGLSLQYLPTITLDNRGGFDPGLSLSRRTVDDARRLAASIALPIAPGSSIQLDNLSN